MKTSALLITIVVALHCAALGALFFIQGCGTTARTGTPPPAMPPMPPTTREAVNYPPPKPSVKAPVVKAESDELPKALGTTEYVVQSGDSIWSIAKQYEISQGEIVELNKLSDPNKLRMGQKLILPGRLKIKAAPTKPAKKAKAVKPAKSATLAEVAAPAAPAEMTTPITGNEYSVLKGDSLSKIAKKCGTTIKALREANTLQGDKLKIGQKLIIPDASAVSAEPAASMTIPAPVESAATPAASMTIPVPVESAATPAASAAPVVEPAPAAAPMSIAGSGITHIVQPSEDINSIAKLYAVTVDEVVELNQLGANRTVKVGQRLKIP